MSTSYFQGTPAIPGNFLLLGREQGISVPAQPEDFGRVRDVSQEIDPKCSSSLFRESIEVSLVMNIG